METKLIYTRISEIMSKVWAIGKDRKNTMQNYSFRGIDDMYNALNTHLAEAKVFFAPEVLSVEREERTTKNGWALTYTVLTMRFTAYAEDGSSVSTVTIGEAMDSGDKSANKAMSTAYKYALMQIFCIPTEEEKDAEYQTHEVSPRTVSRKFIDILEDLRHAITLDSLTAFKDEAKAMGLSEKQEEWLKKEYETIYKSLMP